MSDLRFFPHMGFRPAVQVMQRDQYGDKLIWIVGDDTPYLAKFDPLMGMGSGWVSEAIGKAEIGAKALSGVSGHQDREWASVWRPIEPWDPGPSYPCQCIEVPPIDPAPVPIPASAGLLLLGVCIIAAVKRRKANAHKG